MAPILVTDSAGCLARAATSACEPLINVLEDRAHDLREVRLEVAEGELAEARQADMVVEKEREVAVNELINSLGVRRVAAQLVQEGQSHIISEVAPVWKTGYGHPPL